MSAILGVSGGVSVSYAAQEADSRPLVFGFLPILSAERLVTRFSPLVDYLSRRSGLDIRMETAPDFAAFIERTQQSKRYDILFTAPHFFYLAEKQPGYRGPGARRPPRHAGRGGGADAKQYP